MQQKTYRVAGFVALFALLAIALAALGRQLLAPSCTFVANKDGAFYRTRSSGGVVVLSDSLMRRLLGDNWRSKTLYAAVQSWQDSKGGEMFEPDGLSPLGNFSPPTLPIQRVGAVTDFVLFSREDKTAFLLSVDMNESKVTVLDQGSTAERMEEEALPDGSIRLKRRT